MYLTTAALASIMAGVITQHPHPGHQAYDIACVTGRPIYSHDTGTLTTHTSPTLGHTVTIQGSTSTYLYAHLDTITAQPGPIGKGTQIGTCGNTGRWSTGPHLHLEQIYP